MPTLVEVSNNDIIFFRKLAKYIFIFGLISSFITYPLIRWNEGIIKFHPLSDGYVCVEPGSSLIYDIPISSIDVIVNGNMLYYKFASLDISLVRNNIVTHSEDMHINANERSTFRIDSVDNDQVIITNIYTLRKIYVEVKYMDDTYIGLFIALMAAVSCGCLLGGIILYIVFGIIYPVSIYFRERDRNKNKKLY